MGKQKNKKVSFYFREGVQVVLCAYLFLLLGAFPLYYEDHYVEIGNAKWGFFFRYSRICLLAALVLFLLYLLVLGAEAFGERKRAGTAGESGGERVLKQMVGPISGVDVFALLYLAGVLLSFWFSENRPETLDGAPGWHMGLYAQLLFLLLYFLFSRGFSFYREMLYVHFISSAVVFLLELLNRFQVDPLSMYVGIDEKYKLWFVSTIGQTSWYSSYLCTVLPVGLYAFFISEKPWKRVLSAFYCMLGFASLVTQNSDSAYAALAIVLLALLCLAFQSNRKMERFLELLLLLFFTFQAVGLLQTVFADRMVQIDSLSLFLTQSFFPFACLLGTAMLLALFWVLTEKKGVDVAKYRKMPHFLCAAAAFAVFIGAPLVIWLNTSGRLYDWFGFQKTSGYLYFDRWWGNQRGFNWSFSVQVFQSLPFLHKVIGVGPDGFAYYAYGVPELAAGARAVWGSSQTLTNAHNELLNSLICYGFFGAAAYLGFFLAGARRFFKNAAKAPFVGAAALCILSYLAHNFFCYQQVCCTPFLFLFMGLAEGLIRKKKETETVRDGE